MIRLTPTGQIIYGLLSKIVILLLMLLGTILLARLQALPIPSLVSDIPIHFDLIVFRILDALILTGFVAGGVMMCHESIYSSYLLWVSRLWLVLLIISIITSSLVLIVGLIAFVGLTIAQSEHSRCLNIWQVGMLLIIVVLALGVILDASMFSAFFLTHIAYGIVAVSITFWLINRWSHVRSEWVQDGIVSVSGVVGLAGGLISTSSFPITPIYGAIAGFIVLLCYIILAGHHYRALRDRTQDMSLSPHWIAMATILWLGVGFIGVIFLQLDASYVMQGTRFADVQLGLIRWVMVLVVLGFVNYTATYLRGENRRVTGYMPLWLMGFGVGLSTIIGVCSGIVDIYLRAIIQLDNARISILLLPLDITNMICWFGITAGVIIYALGFVVRRPKIMT